MNTQANNEVLNSFKIEVTLIVFGLCVRCLCALACVSASNNAKPVLAAVGNI